MCTVWDQVHRKRALYGIRYIESVCSMGSGTLKLCILWDQVHSNCALYGIRYIESVHCTGSGT